MGVIGFQGENTFAAMDLIERAIELSPNSAAFFSNRGNGLKDLKRFEEARASYDRALALKPDFAEALNQRGLVLPANPGAPENPRDTLHRLERSPLKERPTATVVRLGAVAQIWGQANCTFRIS